MYYQHSFHAWFLPLRPACLPSFQTTFPICESGMPKVALLIPEIRIELAIRRLQFQSVTIFHGLTFP